MLSLIKQITLPVIKNWRKLLEAAQQKQSADVPLLTKQLSQMLLSFLFCGHLFCFTKWFKITASQMKTYKNILKDTTCLKRVFLVSQAFLVSLLWRVEKLKLAFERLLKLLIQVSDSTGAISH